MKIALIGDVHANLAALEAVLNDMAEKGVDMVISTGDYMGYGPNPEEVVQLLRHIEVMGVAGNYDLKVLKVKKKLRKWRRKRNPKKWDPFLWDFKELSPSAKEYLETLPRERRFSLCGKRFLLTHGSPQKINEALKPDTADLRLAELAEFTGAEVIITGHSHIAFSRKVKGTWFINPGSVGRPVDGDPRASYAILQVKPGYFHFSNYRVDYNIEQTVENLVKKGFPRSKGEMFIKGTSPEEVIINKEEETPLRDETLYTDSGEDCDSGEFRGGIQEDPLVRKAISFMEEKVPVHAPHCRQVARLSLSLFDQLLPLHGIGIEGRRTLELAAHLHDIGWIEGQKGHHKTALKIISEETELLPDENLRFSVASIARYHRKAEPDVKHSHFRELAEGDRNIVRSLSAILRLADGLDWEHLDNVRDILCEIDDSIVRLNCRADHPSEDEKERALEKGLLFEKVFGRRLSILWDQT